MCDTLLKVTCAGHIHRLVLGEQPDYSSVTAAVFRLWPPATKDMLTFVSAEGDVRRLTDDFFDDFLGSAYIGLTGRVTLKLDIDPLVEEHVAAMPRKTKNRGRARRRNVRLSAMAAAEARQTEPNVTRHATPNGLVEVGSQKLPTSDMAKLVQSSCRLTQASAPKQPDEGATKLSPWTLASLGEEGGRRRCRTAWADMSAKHGDEGQDLSEDSEPSFPWLATPEATPPSSPRSSQEQSESQQAQQLVFVPIQQLAWVPVQQVAWVPSMVLRHSL